MIQSFNTLHSLIQFADFRAFQKCNNVAWWLDDCVLFSIIFIEKLIKNDIAYRIYQYYLVNKQQNDCYNLHNQQYQG